MYLCAASVFWVLEKVYLYCGYNTVITPCITDSFPSRYAVIRTHPLYLMFKGEREVIRTSHLSLRPPQGRARGGPATPRASLLFPCIRKTRNDAPPALSFALLTRHVCHAEMPDCCTSLWQG